MYRSIVLLTMQTTLVTTCSYCKSKQNLQDSFANEDKIGVTCDKCGKLYNIIGYVSMSDGKITTNYKYENQNNV